MSLTMAELNRIRWRCRRGMLENDLVLGRFLDAQGAVLSHAQAAQLERLLELTDNELWDLIAGRHDPADTTLVPLVKALRDC